MHLQPLCRMLVYIKNIDTIQINTKFRKNCETVKNKITFFGVRVSVFCCKKARVTFLLILRMIKVGAFQNNQLLSFF